MIDTSNLIKPKLKIQARNINSALAFATRRSNNIKEPEESSEIPSEKISVTDDESVTPDQNEKE